jgi:hypothetical protein
MHLTSFECVCITAVPVVCVFITAVPITKLFAMGGGSCSVCVCLLLQDLVPLITKKKINWHFFLSKGIKKMRDHAPQHFTTHWTLNRVCDIM